MQNALEEDKFVAKVTVTLPGNLPVGDREQVAQFLRDQANIVMVYGPEMADDYVAKLVDTGEDFVSSGVWPVPVVEENPSV